MADISRLRKLLQFPGLFCCALYRGQRFAGLSLSLSLPGAGIVRSVCPLLDHRDSTRLYPSIFIQQFATKTISRAAYPITLLSEPGLAREYVNGQPRLYSLAMVRFSAFKQVRRGASVVLNSSAQYRTLIPHRCTNIHSGRLRLFRQQTCPSGSSHKQGSTQNQPGRIRRTRQ